MPQFFYPSKESITPDHSETARYLGYTKQEIPENKISQLIKENEEKIYQILQPACVYEVFDLSIIEKKETFNIKFADLDFDSKNLGRNLKDCSKIVIFAATIGPQVDLLIRKTEKINTVDASILQAAGAMFIEKTVDLLNKKISQDFALQGYTSQPRYSPGYGDVSLNIQKDFFRLLPCTRIGLTLMDTLIMAPEKSVTAFIGLKN